MENPSSLDDLSRGEALLEELFQRHGDRVFRLALSLLGDRAEAEDATQEVFLKVHSHFQDFKGDSDIYSWMYAIARNHCLHVKRRRRRLSFADLEHLIDEAAAEPALPAVTEEERNRCVEHVREGCLLGLLRCLNLPQRMAFVLNVLLEVSLEETAQVLGKSGNATRILVSRARSGLRAFLCRNCSLYLPGNRCRCSNLVAFSLRNGWIDKDRPGSRTPLEADRIAREVDELKRLVLLYRSLPQPSASRDLPARVRDVLAKEDFRLVSPKKVK